MKIGLLSLMVAGALASAVPAHAFCGFYVSGGDAKLFNNATQVVLMREGTRTALSMANNYEGPPSSFAMVVPVPVILQKENVKTLTKELFDKIDQLDAPRLVEYWEQDPCPKPVEAEEKSSDKVFAPSPVAMAAAAPSPSLGVTVEAQFTVGEYEIVILSAKDAGGLDKWLKAEKYTIPEGSEPYFRPYVQSGSKFFVARVDVTKVKKDEKGNTMLSPLRFHYDSDSFALPVRLGLVNSKGTQDLIVHILAKGQRYEVANYPNVTIPTNLDVSEKARGEFGSFYASLYDSTLAKNPKAVVTEYSWDASTCDPCPGPALYSNDFATLGADVMGPDDEIVAPTPTPTPTPKPTVSPVDCSIPYFIDPKGVKHYKPECLGGGSATPPPAIRPPPRRVTSYYGYTITRLHARYTKESLGEDLVFKAAGPITGGREVRVGAKAGDPGDLEHGSQAASMNNFQGRYAIRHPWTGPIECKQPQRGIWGGPPVGVANLNPGSPDAPSSAPKPAKGLAFVSRDTPLPTFLRSEVPELGVKPSGMPVSGVGGPNAKPVLLPDGGIAPDAKRNSCGCEVGPAPARGAIFASFLALLFCVVRRKNRANPLE